jgi:Zn-dependent peptidase ImmA (M78 family)
LSILKIHQNTKRSIIQDPNRIMLTVKINRKLETKINKDVFISLFDISHIMDYKDYNDAINTNTISFKNLKNLATKAGIPFPLFFASKRVVDKQIANKNKNIIEKVSPKEVIRVTSRGKMDMKDIVLITTDISRKQEFLKNRVYSIVADNTFLGCIARELKGTTSIEDLAKKIRELLKIELSYLRNLSKDGVLGYLVRCIEEMRVFVSFSSYNYMPQNLDPSLELSGFCMKDKKAPFIFINTRDGESKPKIIESEGRQIFTLLAMIACIGMNKFDQDSIKVAFSIAGEIIIPKNELTDIKVATIDDLKEKAHYFKVTPSMVLYRLESAKGIDKDLANTFRLKLKQELKNAPPKGRRAPLPVTGYSKYNGRRFSKEVIKAYNSKKITQLEVNNILFRSGKFNNKLFEAYLKKHR